MVTIREGRVLRAVARDDVILHSLAKLGTRIWLLVSPTTWVNTPMLRVLAVGLLVTDVFRGLRLSQRRLTQLWRRWCFDGSDALLWALTCPAAVAPSAAIVLIIPVVVITVLRRGLVVGLIWTSVAGIIVSTARAAIGKQPFVQDTSLYLGIGLVLAVLLHAAVRQEVARADTRGRALLEADLTAARLAGRNDVVTGVGSEAIDRLQTAIMALTGAGVDAAATLRSTVAAHKRELGEETRLTATYLRDALDRFALSTRADQPRVARHVFFDVDGSDGVVVLSSSQGRDLTRQLGALGLNGVVDVRVLQARDDGMVRLAANGQEIQLAAQRQFVHVPLLPVATVGMGLLFLSLSNPAHVPIPLARTLPFAVLTIAWGLAQGLIVRRRPWLEPWLALSAVVPFTALVLADLHAPFDSHRGVPFLGAVVGLGFVLGIVVAPGTAVFLARASFVVAVVIIALLARGHLPTRLLLAELIWPLLSFLGALTFSRSMNILSARLAEEWAAERAAQVADGRRMAARREISYLRQTLERGEVLASRAAAGMIKDHVFAEFARLRGLLDAT